MRGPPIDQESPARSGCIEATWTRRTGRWRLTIPARHGHDDKQPHCVVRLDRPVVPMGDNESKSASYAVVDGRHATYLGSPSRT